jgi:hypothetical protein
MKSRAGYLLGGCLITLGVVGAIIWFVTSVTSVKDEVNGFQRGPLTGKTTMQLEAHKYVVYYEGPSAEVSVPPFEIEIAEERTGTSLDIALYGGSLTYAVPGHEGSAQATVTPTRAGAYVAPAAVCRRPARTWRSGPASRGSSCVESSARSRSDCCWSDRARSCSP